MPAPSTPVRFDTLLAALSSRFVNLPPGDVDGAIDDALRRICEPLGVDFAALWEWSADESRYPHAHPLLRRGRWPAGCLTPA